MKIQNTKSTMKSSWPKRFDKEFDITQDFEHITSYSAGDIKSFIASELKRQEQEIRERILKNLEKYKCDFNWELWTLLVNYWIL